MLPTKRSWDEEVRREQMSKSTEKLTLYKLLNQNPRKKVDWDALINAAQQNPDAVDSKYTFQYPYGEYCIPLHRAIELGAPVSVIDALCSPKALQQKVGKFNETALHLALREKSPLSVLILLLEKQPDAIRKKNYYDAIPLHYACEFEAPVEVVSLLLDQWPDSIKETMQWNGSTPLHVACECKAPVEVVSLLLDHWPDATKEENVSGDTPLHAAVNRSETSFEVILLLINQWSEAIIHKNDQNQTPFDIAQERTTTIPENTITLLSHASAILSNNTKTHNSSPMDIMTFFIQIMWWKGVRLLLNRHPSITKTMDLHTNIMADFLFVVGYHCSLKTMWEVLRNEQDLLADV